MRGLELYLMWSRGFCDGVKVQFRRGATAGVVWVGDACVIHEMESWFSLFVSAWLRCAGMWTRCLRAVLGRRSAEIECCAVDVPVGRRSDWSGCGAGERVIACVNLEWR